MQATNQRVHTSSFGGNEQAVDMLNDRWLVSMDLPPCSADEAAAIEAFLASLRGKVNTTPLFHFERREPRGTMRGTPTLSAGASQGAASISITATGTLKAGDMLGVGGLLLMVAEDCAASGGVITVPLVNRLRIALSNGAAVTWSRPTAPFRMVTPVGVLFARGVAEGFSADFVEAITS
jgi:hypothetical protein